MDNIASTENRSAPAGRNQGAMGDSVPAAVAVVIPAYNEAATIRPLAERILRTVPSVRLIVIDDGSSDGTAEMLDGLPILRISNQRNLGKGASLWKGFEAALACGAQVVVTLDGDGQHQPEDIPRLLDAFGRFPNTIIIGARLHDRKNFPRRRYYANRCASIGVSWAAGYAVADSQSGFRVYPGKLLKLLGSRELRQPGFAFESELLIVASIHGVRSVAVEIPGIYPKQSRNSHFRPVLDTVRISTMVLGYIARRGLRAWQTRRGRRGRESPSQR